MRGMCCQTERQASVAARPRQVDFDIYCKLARRATVDLPSSSLCAHPPSVGQRQVALSFHRIRTPFKERATVLLSLNRPPRQTLLLRVRLRVEASSPSRRETDPTALEATALPKRGFYKA